MNASGTALQGKHTVEASELYMAFELGEKNWKLSLGDGARSPSRYTLAAGDTAALLECIAKAKARCGLAPEARVRSCYEAGRDGFWLHRWLMAQGIDNIVVDSASIEVNRRARRAKTDRLDGDKLLSMLIRYYADEPRVWSVVRVPTLEEEDARRAHRELGRLGHERTAHINRIRALLVLNNLRVKYVGGRLWQRWWTGHAQELAPGVRAEIERESERLFLVKKQMDTIEVAQRQSVAAGSEPQVARLAQLRGIGMSSGWVLAKELFGWRRFRNRREVAGCLGLTPSPYASGESETEQGISGTPKRSQPRPTRPTQRYCRRKGSRYSRVLDTLVICSPGASVGVSGGPGLRRRFSVNPGIGYRRAVGGNFGGKSRSLDACSPAM